MYAMYSPWCTEGQWCTWVLAARPHLLSFSWLIWRILERVFTQLSSATPYSAETTGFPGRPAYSCYCVLDKTKLYYFSFSLSTCRWMGVFLDYLCFGRSERIYSGKKPTWYLDFSYQECWMQAQQICVMSKILQNLHCNIGINGLWE